MMKTLIDSPPRTIMELYKSLPEGTLVELIENQIYMSPSPLPRHQIVLNEINFQLLLYFKKSKNGMVYISPFDVYLDESGNAVQPDLAVILEVNANEVQPDGHFHGVPDMIVEVLSHGNRDHDRVKKKKLYEKFGVKEYWMVDPETKATEGYTLKNGAYSPLTAETGKFTSPLLGIEINL
ncbi:MAG: Uma2 family endonuclease [Cyclobacteriaceae bacterium]|nr:Uma2 family endonuclease [Cyclobacteriaceae bacterium]